MRISTQNTPYHNQLLGIGANDHHEKFTQSDHGTVDHTGLPGIIAINDTNVNNINVWSSQKITNEINQAIQSCNQYADNLFGSIIDDTVIVSNKTWSSQKINNEISAIIDDNLVVNDKTFSSSKIDSTFEKLSNKGVANGYAPLDSNGKIPNSFIQIDTGLHFAGNWDPNSGAYPSNPDNNAYYNVTQDGTFDGIQWNKGDWAVYVDSITGWQKIDNTSTVTSVNGKNGDVVLTLDDIGDGTTRKLLVINDGVTNLINTWSSQKITDSINNALSQAYSYSDSLIDDTLIVNNKTWSSQKINNELVNTLQQANDYTDALISDSTTEAHKTWSSIRINDTIHNANFVKTDGNSLPLQDEQYDIGDSTHKYNNIYAVTFHGVATEAFFADLSEKYTLASDYQYGTLLVISRRETVDLEQTSISNQMVVGVVSYKPGIIMDSKLKNGVPVALTGKVPVRVIGRIKKGDPIISSDKPGCAISLSTYLDKKLDPMTIKQYFIIGYALESSDETNEKLIRCLIK